MNTDESLRLAFEHYQSGELHEAEALCSEVLKTESESSRALFLLGLIFQESGQFDMAITYYRKALLSDPALVSAYYNLGSIFHEKGQIEEAMANYRRVLDLDPKFADAWNCSGILFYEKGQLEDAITHYQKALEIDPEFVDAYYNLGKALQEKGEPDRAMAQYKKTLELNPDSAEAHNNLGFCLQEEGRFDEALVHFQKAVGLNPNFAEAYYNLALFHHDRNMLDEAIGYYRKAIENNPDFVSAHWNLACALLSSGDFEQGWKEYEWRWKLKGHRGKTFPGSSWEGSDIRGLTILLHSEQGFGDTIQFVRYAPLVAKRGARVIVQCPRELLSLVGRVEGIEQVAAVNGDLPRFDVHCPLLSLPRIFGTDIENIPSGIPYLRADIQSVQEWKERLAPDSPGLRIGLAWSGRTKAKRELERSCPLELFSAISLFEGIFLYSLQKGEGSEQAKRAPADMALVDYTDQIDDFSDTAAFIANLDLVISIDTAVAHLAGALGKPVWVLLPFVPDWRWMLNRDNSPWYPTMRLFRQPLPGDWETVMSNVERELRRLLEKKCIVTGDSAADVRTRE